MKYNKIFDNNSKNETKKEDKRFFSGSYLNSKFKYNLKVILEFNDNKGYEKCFVDLFFVLLFVKIFFRQHFFVRNQI